LSAKLYTRLLKAGGANPHRELVGYLADRPVTTVRHIVATVNRLLAAADVLGRAVTVSLARGQLEPDRSHPEGPQKARIPLDEVIDPYFLDREKVVWDWEERGVPTEAPMVAQGVA
jgi:hypothetical protein